MKAVPATFTDQVVVAALYAWLRVTKEIIQVALLEDLSFDAVRPIISATSSHVRALQAAYTIHEESHVQAQEDEFQRASPGCI